MCLIENYKKVCIIVAGGRGRRFGADIPKQFIEVAGIPLLMHTINRIKSFDDTIEIILVLPENEIPYWESLCINHSYTINHKVVAGGEERFFSVKNALEITPDNSIVAVHDGVRPFVSKDTWNASINCALENGTAIPCVPVTSSLRHILSDNKTESVDRAQYLEVQTPQVFKGEIIKKAYNQEYSKLFTDDASVAESIGVETFVTLGNADNIKITTPIDLSIAEVLITNNK